MAKFLKHKETLIYYDGPELFLGVDQVNTLYLCLLVDRNNENDKFHCVPISSQQINEFYLGEKDLRGFFEVSATGELFYIESDNIFARESELRPIAIDELTEELLPDSGFFYEKEEITDDSVVRDALEKNSAVVHVTLNPPEAREANRISTEHLIETLNVFQSMIKHAFKKSISHLATSIKKHLDISDNYMMDVYAFSPSSFKIHMQSKASGDLFGYVEIARAFNRIDEITESLDNEEQALEIVQNNKGHLANTYLRLLEIIIKNDIPLSYEWTIPEMYESLSKQISTRQARPIYDSLSSRRDLSIEELELIGKVIKADSKHGKWTIVSEDDGKEYRGEIPQDSDLSLTGIVINSIRYRFYCEERIEEIIGTGKEKTRLQLVNYETID